MPRGEGSGFLDKMERGVDGIQKKIVPEKARKRLEEMQEDSGEMSDEDAEKIADKFIRRGNPGSSREDGSAESEEKNPEEDSETEFKQAA